MNYQALMHKSDSLYAFPLDEQSVEIRLRAARGDLAQAELVYGVKHGFYKNRKTAVMSLTAHDALFDYFVIRLALTDKRLAYVFRLTDTDGKKYWFSEDGASEDYDFSKSYYNFFQLAYLNPNDVVKKVDWLSSAVVYQIFVDRFNRGGDGDTGYINLKWGDKPTPKSFAGGDLDGIRQKLGYLCDLGVNTLYLTPIFTSVSNHKYDISDYYNVDPHFGGNAAFERLMNACKARGVRVILDAVFNHCSEHIAQFADVKQKGKDSPYHDWFVIHGDVPVKRPLNYEVFAECDYMPKWNTADLGVQEYLAGVGEHWIKRYGIDGWRLDVSDEVSHEFWRMFRRRIKAIDKDIALIGENWHDARCNLHGDEFDSIMNYAFTKSMTDFFCDGTLTTEGLCDRLNSLMFRNITQINGMMLNLLDCHDTHRFFSLCGRNEDKLINALAVNMFMPGATLIYYGTEIPLEGGYDPDSRRCFTWGDHDFTKRVKELLGYKKLRALSEGDVGFYAEGGMFIAERRTKGQTATLFINNTDSPVTARGAEVRAGGYKITVS